MNSRLFLIVFLALMVLSGAFCILYFLTRNALIPHIDRILASLCVALVLTVLVIVTTVKIFIPLYFECGFPEIEEDPEKINLFSKFSKEFEIKGISEIKPLVVNLSEESDNNLNIQTSAYVEFSSLSVPR